MLNKVKLSYTKTVIYHKDGEVLTKFEPEVFESWLKEEVETEEDLEDLERNIDEVIDEHDRREWKEVNTTFENTELGVSDSDYFGEGPFDQSIQMWMDKKKIESLTQQVESLTQKLESSTF
jgi:molecular chaperone DnaK (HSP70)